MEHSPPPPQHQQQYQQQHQYQQQYQPQQHQQHQHQQQQQFHAGSDYSQQQHYGVNSDFHDEFDAANGSSSGPVKLFVGQVPRNMEEDALRTVLEAFGPLEDIVIIRDKLTGAHRGCAFASFYARDAAEQAIAELHNKVTLPQSINPLQVRPAEGQAGASQEHKLFIGMIPKSADEPAIREVFELFGAIEEVYILRHPATGQSKGCAFLKFTDRNAALQAIEDVNGRVTMDRGTSPLVVKFADSRRQRLQRARNMAAVAATAYWQLPPPPGALGASSSTSAALPFQQMQQLQQQYMQQMQAFNAQAAAMQLPTGGVNPTSPTNSFLYYNPYAFAANNAYTFNPNAVGASGFDTAASSSRMHHAVGSPGAVSPSDVLSSSTDAAAMNAAQRASSQLEGPQGANLFIYHLPHDLTDADLATAFAPFGSVISAKVYMDKVTGESKGFGFVSYDSADAADAAIASMNGFQIGSKRLKVQHKRIHLPRGGSGYGSSSSMNEYLQAMGGGGSSQALLSGGLANEFSDDEDGEKAAAEQFATGAGRSSDVHSSGDASASATDAALEEAVNQLRLTDP